MNLSFSLLFSHRYCSSLLTTVVLLLLTMPSSSLFLRSSATLVSALSLLSAPALAAPTTQQYSLDTDFFNGDFFSNFNFYSDADPTHGFVTYVSQSDAANYGSQNQGTPLIQGGTSGSARMNVDSTNTFDSTKAYYNINGVGRPSVRIESKSSWTHGLIVADIAHMPFACGAWPAFWTLGSGTWPGNGELDIIEGWNDQTTNFASAHVNNACKLTQTGQTGTVADTNCNYNDPFPNYTGCKVVDSRSQSFGAGFNSNGGGTYATDWTSDYIKIWFWAHGTEPSDVFGSHPDPSQWGTPFAYIANSNCNIDQNFNDNRIIFDTTFCGKLKRVFVLKFQC